LLFFFDLELLELAVLLGLVDDVFLVAPAAAKLASRQSAANIPTTRGSFPQ
jgi:hypothetical protein